MLKRLVIMTVMVMALTLPAQADKWVFDKAHSDIGFQVRHLVISKVPGSFSEYDGYVIFDGENWSDARVEVTIQVASINTNNEKRDNHLRSGDFFDVEKYPTMKFKSTGVTAPGDDGKFQIMGDLTIRDVTKPVTLDAEFNGTLVGPMGNMRAGFSASTTINRQDFNVRWDNKLQDGTLIASHEVKINLDVELIKTEEK